jgi:hypothetical protein
VLGVLAVLLGALAGPGTAARTDAQTDPNAMQMSMVVTPAGDVKKGDAIQVAINVANAKNLGSFQFDLLFNSEIFSIDDTGDASYVVKGDFLTSTGREYGPCQPASDPGVVRMRCTTLRATPLGPDGGGKLATVFLKATGSGATELRLNNVKAVDVSEAVNEIPISPTEAITLNVKGNGGMNWMLWGAVIVLGALIVLGGGAFAATRMRGGGTAANSKAAT